MALTVARCWNQAAVQSTSLLYRVTTRRTIAVCTWLTAM